MSLPCSHRAHTATSPAARAPPPNHHRELMPPPPKSLTVLPFSPSPQRRLDSGLPNPCLASPPLICLRHRDLSPTPISHCHDPAADSSTASHPPQQSLWLAWFASFSRPADLQASAPVCLGSDPVHTSLWDACCSENGPGSWLPQCLCTCCFFAKLTVTRRGSAQKGPPPRNLLCPPRAKPHSSSRGCPEACTGHGSGGCQFTCLLPLDQGLADFVMKTQIIDLVGSACLRPLLIPRKQTTWPCSNVTMFTSTKIWAFYHRHIMNHYPTFDCPPTI